MISAGKFLNFSLIIILILILFITILFLSGIILPKDAWSFFLSAIITTLNFLTGLYFFKKGLKKEDKTFIKIVFGSLAARVLLLIPVIIISLKFLEISEISFIFSIFIFYIIYLIIEIIYLSLLRP